MVRMAQVSKRNLRRRSYNEAKTRHFFRTVLEGTRAKLETSEGWTQRDAFLEESKSTASLPSSILKYVTKAYQLEYVPPHSSLTMSFYQPVPRVRCYPIDIVKEGQASPSYNSSDDTDEVVIYAAPKWSYKLGAVVVFATRTWSDPSILLQLTVSRMINTYGYNLDTTAVKLSVVVLLLYCVITVCHLVYSITSGRTSHSWDTMVELFMLALNTRPPQHLKNTSGGVSTFSTYREPVNIRANEDDSLEVIVANQPQVRIAKFEEEKPNQAY